MGVDKWPTWRTEDSPKYKVGIKSPLKVYDVNELSYIISGIDSYVALPLLMYESSLLSIPTSQKTFVRKNDIGRCKDWEDH